MHQQRLNLGILFLEFKNLKKQNVFARINSPNKGQKMQIGFCSGKFKFLSSSCAFYYFRKKLQKGERATCLCSF